LFARCDLFRLQSTQGTVSTVVTVIAQGDPLTPTRRVRLFIISALALFIELALIRYLGSEIRIFAYYKNLVLIACFLGFGVGFYRAAARARLGVSLATFVATVAVVSIGARERWSYGPVSATTALSNFAGSLTMGEENVLSNSEGVLLSGFAWALALFLACLVIMFGFAQQIGADIEQFPATRRLEAYSWNVAGSLLGIAVFSLISWLAIGPVYWFVPALVLTIPWLGLGVERRPMLIRRGFALASAPLLALALQSSATTIWSPYQKLDLLEVGPNRTTVLVNGTGYMDLETFKRHDPRALDRWRLPHTIMPDARNVLVIGAGGGNDVSAALEAGASRVVAVEIDPEILKLGRAHHPDSPYSDPRVHVVIDDARHYGETATERFDLIVFSHLDSHTALSGFTNVRLDNYIYTVESFRTFQRLLAPQGALYVSFFSTRLWVAERLKENLRLAFDREPVPLYARLPMIDASHEPPHADVLNAHFWATSSAALRARAELLQRASFRAMPPTPTPPPSTDDWPYLFVQDRHVPIPMLLLALMLATVSAGFTAMHVRRELRAGSGWPIDRHFFCLGAGFLLVEVHNVGKLARVFGTTWSVNAWVIAAVLSVILAANALVSRRPSWFDPRIAYAGLISCLLASALVPVETLLALPLAWLLITVFYTLPLFFAGIIFAHSFRNTELPLRALGSNLLGSLLGGFLELASFTVGLSALMLVAALVYALSYPLPARSSKQAQVPTAA
jgi:spermidine synthase